jgi:drug/metabolite transporter (DMT)-like permease
VTSGDRAAAPPPRARRPLLTTSAGTNVGAFRPADWGLLSAIALVWGSSFLFMEIGLAAFRPGVITLARIGLGALALGLVPRARRSVDRADLPTIAFLGLIWMAIPLTLFPVAQQWVDSSVAGMVNGAMPLTTAAWAALLIRKLPGANQLIGLAIGFAGVVAISWPEVRDSQATALGVGLLVLAVVCYGLSANIAVPLQQKYGALPVLLRAQLAALVVVVPFGLWSLPGSTWAWGPALAMLPVGILGTGVAFVLMASLVGRVGGPRGAVAIYFVPIVAIVLGVVLLREPLAPLALVGTLLVLIGAWLASRRT